MRPAQFQRRVVHRLFCGTAAVWLALFSVACSNSRAFEITSIAHSHLPMPDATAFVTDAEDLIARAESEPTVALTSATSWRNLVRVNLLVATPEETGGSYITSIYPALLLGRDAFRPDEVMRLRLRSLATGTVTLAHALPMPHRSPDGRMTITWRRQGEHVSTARGRRVYLFSIVVEPDGPLASGPYAIEIDQWPALSDEPVACIDRTVSVELALEAEEAEHPAHLTDNGRE